MRALHWLGLLTILTATSLGMGQEKAVMTGDPTKVFLIVDQPQRAKGKVVFSTMTKEMVEALTKERPTMPQRRPLGGFTPIKGESSKTMFADAIKAKAGRILHVSMLESVKESAKGGAPRRTILTAEYTLYEPKKDASADKPTQYWQKASTEKLKTVAAEVDPDTFAAKALSGKVSHDAYQFMAVDLRAALVKRVAATKAMEGKVTDKDTLTVTVTVVNSSKMPILGMTLSLPQDDSVNYCHVAADLQPGETKKVTFKISDSAANKLIWKNAKLSEVFLDRGGAKDEPKQ